MVTHLYTVANTRMPPVSSAPRSCQELLVEYRSLHPVIEEDAGQTLQFGGVGDKDVITSPRPLRGTAETYLLGRVERATPSILRSFSSSWLASPGLRLLPSLRLRDLQDPCITFVDGELILGGVEVSGVASGWLHRLADGVLPRQQQWTIDALLHRPDKMKDIRFKQLEDGRIAIFTRPQGVERRAGQDRLRHRRDSFEEMTAEMIEEAPLIENQFLDSRMGWGQRSAPPAKWPPRCVGPCGLVR